MCIRDRVKPHKEALSWGVQRGVGRAAFVKKVEDSVARRGPAIEEAFCAVSYTHLRAHETRRHL
eukprot:12755282-Prorocentrum_lima.AAC.1